MRSRPEHDTQRTKEMTSNVEVERGAGMTEYALLMLLVTVALIAGFQGLATAIGAALTAAVNSF